MTPSWKKKTVSYFYRPNSFQSYLRFECLYNMETTGMLWGRFYLYYCRQRWRPYWLAVPFDDVCGGDQSSLSLFIAFFCFMFKTYAKSHAHFFIIGLHSSGTIETTSNHSVQSFWFRCFDRSTSMELLIVFVLNGNNYSSLIDFDKYQQFHHECSRTVTLPQAL